MYRTSPLSGLSGQAEDQISSEVSILQSRTLYLRVAKDLDLVNNPDFFPRKPGTKASLDDPAVRDSIVRSMKAKITIAHKPKEEIIDISCATTYPNLSAKVVNTLINDLCLAAYPGVEELRYHLPERD